MSAATALLHGSGSAVVLRLSPDETLGQLQERLTAQGLIGTQPGCYLRVSGLGAVDPDRALCSQLAPPILIARQGRILGGGLKEEQVGRSNSDEEFDFRDGSASSSSKNSSHTTTHETHCFFCQIL